MTDFFVFFLFVSCLFVTFASKINKHLLEMEYKLSNDTRRNLENSTGQSYDRLVSTPIAVSMKDGGAGVRRSLFSAENSRVIPPRGSVLLLSNRVRTLKDVRSHIFNFGK